MNFETELFYNLKEKYVLAVQDCFSLIKNRLPAIIQKLIYKGENCFHLIICGSSQQLL
jgi:hypothetical protein